MATLKENYRAIIDAINQKLSKKIEKEDLQSIEEQVQQTTKDISKINLTTRTLNAKVSDVEEYADDINQAVQEKMSASDIKTINGQSLKTTEGNTNLEIPLPKNNLIKESEGLIHPFVNNYSTSSSGNFGWFYRINPTQEEIDAEYEAIQGLYRSTTYFTPYYISKSTSQNTYNTDTVNVELNTNPGDFLFVHLWYGSTTSSYYPNKTSDYSTAVQLIRTEIIAEDDWTVLEDTWGRRDENGIIPGGSESWGVFRHIVYYKRARKSNEFFNATIAAIDSKYPDVYIDSVSVSNADGFTYIPSTDYKEIYDVYREEHPSVDKGILPMPEMGDSDLALICSANILGQGSGSITYFEGPKIYSYSQNFTYQKSFLISDEPIGYLSTANYGTGKVRTDPFYGTSSCIILRGVKDSTAQTEYDKYECVYRINSYQPVQTLLEQGFYDVELVPFFKKRPILYATMEDAEGRVYTDSDAEIANKRYVDSKVQVTSEELTEIINTLGGETA